MGYGSFISLIGVISFSKIFTLFLVFKDCLLDNSASSSGTLFFLQDTIGKIQDSFFLYENSVWRGKILTLILLIL